MLRDERYITIEETALILSVSSATVRNWIKHEYLHPSLRARHTLFRRDEVFDLKKRIGSGSVSRLAGRANKASAAGSFIPGEYIMGSDGRGPVEKIISIVEENGLDHDRALFVLALSRLFSEGICPDRSVNGFVEKGFRIPARVNLSREFSDWHAALGRFRFADEYVPLFSVDLPGQRDALGLVYQSLLREGEKARTGSYYTPDRIVDDIAEYRAGGTKPGLILDPCCGTGQFLLAFAGKVKDPRSLHGMDTDRLAVRLARINLMLAFRDRDFDPRIVHGNFVQAADSRDRFDVIATNPPWGVHLERGDLERLESLHPRIRSSESFSYFLKAGIDGLRENGALSFILPESILNVTAHGDIRKYILDTARIEGVTHLGRVFSNVFTPAIRLDLRKDRKKKKLLYSARGGSYRIDQARFMKNSGCIFDVRMDSRSEKIIEKIYGIGHRTLAGNAEWALGIVTGDNGRHLCADRTGGREKIYTGKDVERYFLSGAENYIRFTPEAFQQSAPEWKYRAKEKLVYRFISRNLVVAYDERGCLTLNSANIVIPDPAAYPVKAVLALFNSSPYQYVFQKKFSSIKVLRSHLEKLPLPLWGAGIVDTLAGLADEVLARRAPVEEADEFIMELFRFTAGERELIRASIS